MPREVQKPAGLDYQAYPHIFNQIIKQTDLPTYVSLRLLNKSIKGKIDGGFGKFIFSDTQIDPEESHGDAAHMPVYIVQVHDGNGYQIAVHRSQTTKRRSPGYRINRKGKTIFSKAVSKALLRMTRFLVKMGYGTRRQKPDFPCHLEGDCLRDHTIVHDMLSLLHSKERFPTALILRPGKSGDLATRLKELPYHLIFVDNWRACSGQVVDNYARLGRATYHIDGSERCRLLSTSFTSPIDICLDFTNFANNNTSSMKRVAKELANGDTMYVARLQEELINLAMRTLIGRKCFKLCNLAYEAMVWLDHWHGPHEELDPSVMPWDHVMQQLCASLQQHKISFDHIRELVNIHLPSGRFTCIWTSSTFYHSTPSPHPSDRANSQLRSVHKAISNMSSYYGMLTVSRSRCITDSKWILDQAKMELGESIS